VCEEARFLLQDLMTHEQFCYWLQGLLEVGVADGQALQPNQVKAIKEHLATVFCKITSETFLVPPVSIPDFTLLPYTLC
jgi:hypothetical protein